MAALIVVGLMFAILGVPSYVIGRRRGVSDAWVAFIPIAGPTMVLLWSIDEPGWMMILGFVPLVNIAFGFWLLFAMPSRHDRSLWWGVACMVPLVGMYAYAFTLPESSGPTMRGALANN